MYTIVCLIIPARSVRAIFHLTKLRTHGMVTFPCTMYSYVTALALEGIT